MGTYNIESAIRWFDAEQAWTALHPASCEHVLIILVVTMDHMRDAAWEKLHHVKSPHITEARDSRLVLENRYEVYHLPDGITLRAWLAKNGPPPAATLNLWIKNLHSAVAALHEQNVAHCYLCPDCIYVEKSEEGPPHLVVGGLERSVRFDRTEMIQISGDPFYAPPESAGLYRQTPGDAMKAWDWWSVGRIVQELVLGRHILEHLLDHALDRSGAEEREQAEKLLLEKAHGETRAGGVEAMPPMDKRIDLLLMGLLAGARDARWNAEEIGQWIKGESPAERYKLSRGERLFKWRGRSYTVPEAAEAFRSEANWELAPDQLMRKDNPDTLISFIKDQPNLRIYAQKIDECMVIANAPDLRPFNVNLIRELAVANALHRLAGGAFVWRGKRVDSSMLKDLLAAEDGKGDQLAIVQILCTPPILGPLEKLDFEAFRVLSEGSKLAARAIALATRMKLMPKNSTPEIAKIWALAFESPSYWLEQIRKLHETYACSEKPDIQELFTRERGLPEETLILTWLIPNVAKLSFITHEEWSKREYGKLHQRGRQLAHALFWNRLGSSLNAGIWWFGRIGIVLAAWAVLTAILSLAWPGPFYIPLLVLPLMLAAVMRFSLKSLVQPLLNTFLPGQTPWKLWDGTQRCKAEAMRFPEGRLKRSELKEQIEGINTELANLKYLNPPPALIPLPPRMMNLRLIALLSWLVLLLPTGIALKKIHATANPVDDFLRAWFPKEEELEYYPPPPPYRIEFPFTVPKKVRLLKFEDALPPTEIQTKLGIRRGASLVGGYTIDTIGACILVRVPSDAGLSFVIYDPKRSDLASKKVYNVRLPPKRNTCVSLDGKVAFVLDY
jgi:hypothetical protein